jgi:hypothetical protein
MRFLDIHDYLLVPFSPLGGAHKRTTFIQAKKSHPFTKFYDARGKGL